MLRALLALQVMVVTPSPDPADPYRLPPTNGPQLGAIEVRGDSVLFFTMPELQMGQATTTVYAFSRADQTWSRAGVDEDGARGNPFGHSDGWWWVRDGYWWGDEGARLLADRYFRPPAGEVGIVRLEHLLLYPDTDTIRFAVPAPTDPGLRPSPHVSSLAVLSDTLWLGLSSYGHTSGQGGTRGGLVAFDLRERETSASWLPQLERSSVHEIEQVEGRLWLATDYGIGIRDTDGSWEWLGEGDRGLPSSRVWAIEPMGDTVWLATGAGPGGFADGSWFGRRWTPVVSADSVVMDLTTAPPTWSEANAILRLAWMLRLDRSGAGFVDAMSRLPREVLDAWGSGARSYESIVMEPSLYPHLVDSYLLRPGSNRLAGRAVARRVPEAEAAARDLLRRANASSAPDARRAAYDQLRDGHPDLIIEDARELLSRESAPDLDRIRAVQALGPLGDVSDLPVIFRHAPRWDGGSIDDRYFRSIAEIIARSNPAAVASALRQQPISDRIITLRWIRVQPWQGWRTAGRYNQWTSDGVPRPTLVAECLVALDALTDPSATVGNLDAVARVLDALGVPESIPFSAERPSWRPEGIIARLRTESEAERGLPLDPDAPGFDALRWARSWWAQVGRHRPPTDCWMLPAMGLP